MLQFGRGAAAVLRKCCGAAWPAAAGGGCCAALTCGTDVTTPSFEKVCTWRPVHLRLGGSGPGLEL